jgi:(p)ppGpp synthase/HD superfamily hydrolase
LDGVRLEEVAALTDRFDKALVYAHRLHRGQSRKTPPGTPYISHLLGVASIVLENGGNEDEAIAALLHDAAEDQGGERTLREIKEMFGETVASIVEGCTEDDSIRDYRIRKKQHLERLRNLSNSVSFVYAGDKLYNARAILLSHALMGEEVWSRYRAGKDGVLWYYDEAVKTFRGRIPPAMFQILEQTVRRMAEL